MTNRCRASLGSIAIGLGLLASALNSAGNGGETRLERAGALDQEKDKLPRFIYGARHCAGCHNQDKNQPIYKPDELERLSCKMDESATFDTQDKHKLAFAALTGRRGREMSRLLGTEVTRMEACLNCHSVPERGAESHLYRRDTDGVTCVACHGTHADWVEKHQRASREWRDLDRKAKESRFGMTDLWDPTRRALVCAACHIGNHGEGKVITHAMYVAGHPPLPSFEVATFSDFMPRHWQNLREKSRERTSLLKPAPDPRSLEETKLVLAGELVALRESLKLLAQEAAASKPAPIGAAWPDFARFDCYACHHELRADDGASWRQLRRRDGFPGRPTPPEWPLVLVQLGMDAAGAQTAAAEEDRFRRHLAALNDAILVRPFGEQEPIAKAADELVKWVDSLLERVSHAIIDDTKARRLLVELGEIALQTIPDYNSARQIAWAFRVIYWESTPEDKRDPKIETELAGLESDLALNLPPARKQALIEDSLPDRLRSAAVFDPASFQARFRRMNAHLMRR
jgi:hypothetical protein